MEKKEKNSESTKILLVVTVQTESLGINVSYCKRVDNVQFQSLNKMHEPQ